MELYQVLKVLRTEYDGSIEPIVISDDIYTTRLELTLGSLLPKNTTMGIMLDISKLPVEDNLMASVFDVTLPKKKQNFISIPTKDRGVQFIRFIVNELLTLNSLESKYEYARDESIVYNILDSYITLLTSKINFKTDIDGEMIHIKDGIVLSIFIRSFMGSDLIERLNFIRGALLEEYVSNTDVEFEVSTRYTDMAKELLSDIDYKISNGLLLVKMNDNIDLIIEPKKAKYNLYFRISGGDIIRFKRAKCEKLVYNVSNILQHGNNINRYIISHIAVNRYHLDISEKNDCIELTNPFQYTITIDNDLIENNIGLVLNKLRTICEY